MNVLILDDIATNRKLLRAQLEAEGVTVSENGDIELPAEAKADGAPIETPGAEGTEIAVTNAAENPELRKAS